MRRSRHPDLAGDRDRHRPGDDLHPGRGAECVFGPVAEYRAVQPHWPPRACRAVRLFRGWSTDQPSDRRAAVRGGNGAGRWACLPGGNGVAHQTCATVSGFALAISGKSLPLRGGAASSRRLDSSMPADRRLFIRGDCVS